MKRALKWFAASTLAGMIYSVFLWGFGVYDDAYITFRYARNVAAGLGPVYNAGERVEGCTTFLQMMILAPFIRLGADPRFVSVALSILALALIVAMGVWLLGRIYDGEKLRLASFAYGFFIMTNPGMILWTISGMETILYSVALAAVALSLWRDLEKDKAPVAAALACVVAALIRPDGVVIAGFLTLAIFWKTKNQRWKNALIFSLIFGILYGVYFAWRFHYYGWFYPNTYYAKVGGFKPIIVIRGMEYWIKSIFSGAMPLIPLLMLVFRKKLGLKLGLLEIILVAVIAAQSFQSIMSGGDFMPFYRFMIPVWPLLALLALSLTQRIAWGDSKGFFGRLAGRMHRRRGIAIAVLIINASTIFMGLSSVKAFTGAVACRAWEKNARILSAIVPPDSLIAATAIGAFGWYIDGPLIDLLGLTDETIAHTKTRTRLKSPRGHERYNTKYVLKRRPDFILFCVQTAKTPFKECGEIGKVLPVPAYRDMVKNAQFLSLYRYANHKIDGGYIATFIRRSRLGKPGFEGWFVTADAPKTPTDAQWLDKKKKK